MNGRLLLADDSKGAPSIEPPLNLLFSCRAHPFIEQRGLNQSRFVLAAIF
jgi:hypothetical protein